MSRAVRQGVDLRVAAVCGIAAACPMSMSHPPNGQWPMCLKRLRPSTWRQLAATCLLQTLNSTDRAGSIHRQVERVRLSGRLGETDAGTPYSSVWHESHVPLQALRSARRQDRRGSREDEQAPARQRR